MKEESINEGTKGMDAFPPTGPAAGPDVVAHHGLRHDFFRPLARLLQFQLHFKTEISILKTTPPRQGGTFIATRQNEETFRLPYFLFT